MLFSFTPWSGFWEQPRFRRSSFFAPPLAAPLTVNSAVVVLFRKIPGRWLARLAQGELGARNRVRDIPSQEQP